MPRRPSSKPATGSNSWWPCGRAACSTAPTAWARPSWSSTSSKPCPTNATRRLVLSHSSVTGTDLLRLLCTELGQTARMRRSDNVLLIRQGWQQLDRLWPVVVLDEAQNLSATALEEVRLLSCDRRDTQPPFSLLLVGDEQLLPRLQMGINAPLLARLSFCLRPGALDRRTS